MFKLERIVRKNILSLQPYSSARDEFSGTSGVFLDANENPFGKLNRYPDPYQKVLKQKLAKLKKVDNDNIFVGNGSDEVIDLAYRIFCEPNNDKVLTFSPTYGMYDVSAAINAIELIKIPLTDKFQIDLNLTNDYLSESALKIIFICSPNNPTGNIIDKSDIEYLLNSFKGIVIIDEAYIDFCSSESWCTMLDQYPNLIVSQTFSKAWGLAAARVGVAYASKEIIQLFNRVKPPYNMSEPNQNAAISALSDYNNFLENIQAIKKEKEKLTLELNQLDLVMKIYPSDANFLLVEVTDANRIYNDLVDQKIITRNRNNVIRNCIRISIGTPKENEILLNALKNINR
ncbi:MAG: histidinol-phosphate transaminase [Cyclobacteriaceae bacterium]|nr:histidinol-phosphate transaminase [Cyclobacteriaceae bacterium]